MLFFSGIISQFPFISAVTGIILALLIGMTVHEWAHNYVAHLMGDPVPARLGRLTLNPLAHIYWPGFIMVLVIGFGILGTAPIAAHRMRNPRYGYLAAVAAGPFSNLLVAIVAAIFFRLLGSLSIHIETIFFLIVVFNVMLFLFNLLPFAPLDGWSIVYSLLPPREAMWWERNRQNSQFIFFALILIGFALPFSPLGFLIGEPLFFIIGLLLG